MGDGRLVRIGNAAGFWGDQRDAPKHLVEKSRIDYLTLEYLAELTLSILAHQKSKRPEAGFANDFPDTIRSLLPTLQAQPQLKIVTNAGGMNPRQCAFEVSQVLHQAGLSDCRVAAVSGDDLVGRLGELRDKGESFTNWESGDSFEGIADRVVSANAYLGAQGIVDAFNQDARIVITGRVADASLCVGPLIHEFGWSWQDWERLGQATVAGHLIECGAQASGGIDSTWTPEISLGDVGYPIAEVDEAANVWITKPVGSGGRVTVATVAEQLVYEIGDPAHYLTPDVDADFRQVQLEQVAEDRVRVTGGTGNPAPATLKVSLAYYDGFMSSGTIVLAGPQAIAKARYAAEMVQQRLQRAGIELAAFGSEVLGSGDSVGGATRRVGGQFSCEPWEVVLRIAARDPSKENLDRMGRELAPLVTSGPPGVTGYTGARPRPHPVLSFWPTLVSREHCHADVETHAASEWQSSSMGQ